MASSLCVLLVVAAAAGAQSPAVPSEVDGVFADARALYVALHKAPELSGHETATAAMLAGQLRAAGYDVTEHVGGTGLVALLKNGSGPTIMLRTELDALPVEEKTGLPYASTVRTRDAAGRDVAVMHACGHDLHMAAFVGAATVMARSKDRWHGTLMLVGQPAEETISGAKAMVADPHWSAFPKPAAAVALHVGNWAPAGTVGVGNGPRLSNADSLRITIYGKGGHGAMPQSTVDPIVIAARTILALQTIVSREIKPGEVAVVTVGTVQAGTKNNIIPDQAEIGLSVRTYKPEVRTQVLAAITRIVNAEAAAAGAVRTPQIDNFETTDAVYNDPALGGRLEAALVTALGRDRVLPAEGLMASEDFSVFTAQGVPSYYLFLGGAPAAAFADAARSRTPLPSIHSALFAPDVDPALRTGIEAEVTMLRALLAR